MIIDRKHVGWGIGTTIAIILVAVLYAANTHPEVLEKHGVHLSLPEWLGPVPPRTVNFGATPLGLIYGTVALLIFIFAALLGARRKHPVWPMGSIQFWLRAHIWLTVFTIPLVAFHCGFHGGGPMTQFLLWLYGLVMVSGFWGLALQNIVPRMMRQRLSEEVVFEQIPFIRRQLIDQAGAIRAELVREQQGAGHAEESGATVTAVAAPSIAAVAGFVEQEVLPYLQATASRHSKLRTKETSDSQFRLLQLQMPEPLHGPLVQLQELCDEKRQLDWQARLHYWLHGWLVFHAPSSVLLIGLTVVHAVVAKFLYP